MGPPLATAQSMLGRDNAVLLGPYTQGPSDHTQLCWGTSRVQCWDLTRSEASESGFFPRDGVLGYMPSCAKAYTRLYAQGSLLAELRGP